MRYLLGAVLAAVSVGQVAADSYFWPNNTFSPDNQLSAGCQGALLADVACDPYLLQLTNTDSYGSLNGTGNNYYTTVCTAACKTALTNYIANVSSHCSADPQPFNGYPATWQGTAVFASYNMTCLKDSSTGQFCQDYFATLPDSTTGDLDLSNFTTTQLCNTCIYSLFRQIQGTPYSNYQSGLVGDWQAIQQRCAVSGPTVVQPLDTNVTDVPNTVPKGLPVDVPCISGQTYTVAAGDSVQAIAQAKSVATGTLIVLNNLLPDGSDLQAGQTLCLPQTCTTRIVQSGDTCLSLSSSINQPWQVFLAWNPTVNPVCTNLIAGRSICMSQPGQAYSGTTIPGATATKTAIYATSTVAPPGAVASGTTLSCGSWYKVLPGDYCQLIALNQTIDLALFEAINPSINTGCSNLVPGLYYCVEPTEGWNASASTSPTPTATLPPPTTVPSGTTNACYRWYVIQSGDSCSLIEASFGITFAQLQGWNPSLKSDCSNLLLGEAYCVEGGTAVTATATSTSTFATPGAPTPSGTTGQCFVFHTVVSGDSCFAIEQTYGITMAQLQAWNPQLASDCSNLLLGDAYCVSGVTPSSSSTGVPSTTTAFATPGAPTPSGTTSRCFQYHTIVSGDTCFGIEQTFGITMAQLQAWNPQLASDCSNLLLGEAYCVQGAAAAKVKREAVVERAGGPMGMPRRS
ncbi:hypothetical protein QBC47DRAFT_434461 [Echria macrotheca]|uniref:LysM domain-containing protein n=1 Tax=Echria macrotheca TaxID=438768 RepID=A0AAJ0B484_9PEZI|nr:hypothetical protein QBC47DRAFT_434461 [Echria macrotheca]